MVFASKMCAHLHLVHTERARHAIPDVRFGPPTLEYAVVFMADMSRANLNVVTARLA